MYVGYYDGKTPAWALNHKPAVFFRNVYFEGSLIICDTKDS